MKIAKRLRSALLAIPIIISVMVYRANVYPKGYYGNPLDIPVELAANFGEVRTGHFHMGLDIRTNGKESLPVHAAADGFISRITIEEAGFGKAVYITHPNGTISVYGHLNRFMPELENYVQARQYKDENWRQDIQFREGLLPVTKGQLVAFSGNTGASEGPHLHFEIRDMYTGNNLNPLLNGFALRDEIAPAIQGLYWYGRTQSIYALQGIPVAIAGCGNNCYTAEHVITVSSPCISFGIEATDKNAATKYKLGLYKVMECMNDKLVFGLALDSVCYHNTRYVNACVDYKKWFQESKCIQLLCKLPGNRLQVFESKAGNGVLQLGDGKVHAVKILVYDAAGNTAAVRLKVKFDSTRQQMPGPMQHGPITVPGTHNAFSTAKAKVDFSPAAFYDTVPFTMYEEAGNEANTASVLVHLHNAFVPVHDAYTLQIKTSLALNSPLKNHVVMQLTNDKHTVFVKGTWKGNMMVGCFNELGDVQLVVDTIAPDIQCREGDNSRFSVTDKAMHIVCKDNFGEAAYFKGMVDGHWVLFEKKGDLFTHYFDSHCPPGKHILLFTAVDIAGNTATKAIVFWKE